MINDPSGLNQGGKISFKTDVMLKYNYILLLILRCTRKQRHFTFWLFVTHFDGLCRTLTDLKVYR